VASKPKRPYLLRALYDWIIDSDLTPYLLVTVDSAAVQVPADYVDEGKIVLNVSPMAIREFVVDEESVSFSGRFGGKSFPIFVPMPNVVAVYAKETGEGMMFDPEYELEDQAPSQAPEPVSKPGASHLTVIK
jgi:stringent starvation protein B